MAQEIRPLFPLFFSTPDISLTVSPLKIEPFDFSAPSSLPFPYGVGSSLHVVGLAQPPPHGGVPERCNSPLPDPNYPKPNVTVSEVRLASAGGLFARRGRTVGLGAKWTCPVFNRYLKQGTHATGGGENRTYHTTRFYLWALDGGWWCSVMRRTMDGLGSRRTAERSRRTNLAPSKGGIVAVLGRRGTGCMTQCRRMRQLSGMGSSTNAARAQRTQIHRPRCAMATEVFGAGAFGVVSVGPSGSSRGPVPPI